MTHNMNDCAKYEKDGSLKVSWGDKGKSANKMKKSEGRSFAQLLEQFLKMEKAIKKSKKSASCKKKCHYDSDSSSNSK